MHKNLWITITLVAFLFAITSIGCEKKEPEVTKPPQPEIIKIGAIMPLTGDVASYGIPIKQGIELAAKKVNAEGMIKGKEILVIYEDSKAEPKEGVAAAQKLISVDKVNAIIGAVASSVTLAVVPVAERSHTVLLSAASSSPKITIAGDYIFRNYPSDTLEGKLVAEFAIQNGYTTAAILTINNDYGNGLNEIFSEIYSTIGGEITLNDKFIEGTTDFRTLLTKLKANPPSCIFIVGYGKELGTMVKQARELGLDSQFLSTVNFHDPESLSTGGTAVEGVIFSSPVFDPSSTSPNVAEFVREYNNAYNKDPDVWAAHGYDALLLLAHAILNNGISPDNIKFGLYSIKNFPGVSGLTTFDPNGDVMKEARFMTVRNADFLPY